MCSKDVLGDELFYNWDFHYSDSERDCLLNELNAQVNAGEAVGIIAFTSAEYDGPWIELK